MKDMIADGLRALRRSAGAAARSPEKRRGFLIQIGIDGSDGEQEGAGHMGPEGEGHGLDGGETEITEEGERSLPHVRSRKR